MAEKLDRSPGAYKRNENGETFPEYSVLYNMAKKFDVSIDWLLCEKGPMFYSEKEDSMIQLEKDYKELISHMQKDSILRYEILLIFRKYLEGKNHSEN
jgi:transcriptional regulator with XRE-family HTH domain